MVARTAYRIMSTRHTHPTTREGKAYLRTTRRQRSSHAHFQHRVRNAKVFHHLWGAVLSRLDVLAEVLVRPAGVSKVHNEHPHRRQLVRQADQLCITPSLKNKHIVQTEEVRQSAASFKPMLLNALESKSNWKGLACPHVLYPPSLLMAWEKTPLCAWGSWVVLALGCFPPRSPAERPPARPAEGQPIWSPPREQSFHHKLLEMVHTWPRFLLPLGVCCLVTSQVSSLTTAEKGVEGLVLTRRLRCVHHPAPPLATRLHLPPAQVAATKVNRNVLR